MKSAKEETRIWADIAWNDFEHGQITRAQLSMLAAIAHGLLAVAETLEQLLVAPNADDHADQAIEEELHAANG